MIGRIRRDCGLGLGRHCTYDLYLVPFSSAESDVKHQPTNRTTCTIFELFDAE